jgi:hypothetical protein
MVQKKSMKQKAKVQAADSTAIKKRKKAAKQVLYIKRI